jgi:GNAT superfamily N-acetyltransferase
MHAPFCRPRTESDLVWRCGREVGWDEDAVATFVGTEATGIYFKLLGEARSEGLCIQATWQETAPCGGGPRAISNLAALALVVLEGGTAVSASTRTRVVTCTLVGLAVAENLRRQGIGQALFERTHAEAFRSAQLRVLGAKSISGVLFDFRLHDGTCFKNPAALRLYQNNGARVQLGEHIVAEDTLRAWAENNTCQATAAPAPSNALGMLAQAAACEVGGATTTRPGARLAQTTPDPLLVGVHFEKLHLDAPYLAPRAFPGAQSAKDGDAFLDLAECLPATNLALGDMWWAKGIRRNVSLKLGALTIGGVEPDPTTGCVALAVTAHPCSLLEGYLRDPRNTVPALAPAPHPVLVLKWDEKGDPASWIAGYDTYVDTAAPNFCAASQLLRTRHATTKEQKTAVLELPGCTAILEELASLLRDHEHVPGTWSRDVIMKPEKVHILCQDEDLQAGFDWHTDGPSIRVGEEREDWLVGLAVQLSDSAASAIWVHGFRPQVYLGRGACVLFHGGSVHRTLPWSALPPGRKEGRNVIKIVFFYIIGKK